MNQQQQRWQPQWAYQWPDGPPGGGVCPVCGALIGVAAETSPATGRAIVRPSLLLELSGSLGGPGWRLTVWGGSESAESTYPEFDSADVRWRYALCGNGHYFLCWVSQVGEDGQQSWRHQSYVAAIGPTASGKSYLLTRTLNQSLTAMSTQSGGSERVQRIEMSDPLEGTPRRILEAHYLETFRRGKHERMPPTMTSELLPGRLLNDELNSPEIPAAAAGLQSAAIQRKVEPEDWGVTFRQPIFVRSKLRDQTVLTCVADLAGELFDTTSRASGFVGSDSLGLLRRCDALLWVVDPFHSDRRFEEFLRDALDDGTHYDRVLKGSSRADSLGVDGGYEAVLDLRSSDHENIARALAADRSDMVSNLAGTLRQLVAVTKCDLFELALRTKNLVELDEDEDRGVVAGVARYLLYLSDRTDPEPTPAVRQLLEYLRGSGVNDQLAARRRRTQIAAALVSAYSDHAAFWNLVQGGKPAEITATAEADRTMLRPFRMQVPSVDEHLRAYLESKGPNRLHMRDAVMSALGCGVMFGLGNAEHLEEMLSQGWRYLQFFLCSPLGTVPLTDGDDKRIEPSDRPYPKVTTRSAALVQLNLGIMRQALL
jgi:hypothetical protein